MAEADRAVGGDAGELEPTHTGWTRKRRREVYWTAIAVAVTTAIGLVDTLGSRDALFVGVLVAGPLLASFGASARATALVSVYAVAVALVVGIPHDVFLELDDHLTRVASVVVGGALAFWIARARERERTARRRYTLIANTSDLVQRTQDPKVMMTEVARLLANELGDWCFVFLRAEPKGIRQVAAAHCDAERQRLAWELLERYPLDPGARRGPGRDPARRALRASTARWTNGCCGSISADEENLGFSRRSGCAR